VNALNPTQSLQSISDLIDDGTTDGRNMLWRRQRWVRRWDSFLTTSGVLAALGMAVGVMCGCVWIVWEVLASAVSMVSSIFN
jgi:hypothetical protein